MNEKEIKKIELETNNLLQFRSNCIAFVGLLVGGLSGLMLSNFNYLKLIFILIGLLILYFLFMIINTVDEDIETKIKELEK